MAEDLGEVKVKIKEEGVDDAADQIADATGEAGSGGGGSGGSAAAGGSGGSTVGELLGGIGSKLTAILGLVGVLASLKPIQELLKGIARILSITLLPFVALINTFLRPVLAKLLRFIGNTDLDSSIQEFTKKLSLLIQDFADALVDSIKDGLDTLFGGNGSSSSEEQIAGLLGGTLLGSTGGPLTGVIGGQAGKAFGSSNSNQQSPIQEFLQNPLNVSVGILGEQSPSGVKQNASSRVNEETTQNGLGGTGT